MSDTIDDILYPDKHYLKSIIARPWTLWGALEELIDNSIAHGKATYVSAMIFNTHYITVSDNGIGMNDLNLLYQLGRTSDYDNLSQIGQFGSGGGHACIWLGDKVTTSTMHNSVEHKYAWDWSEGWARRYRGEGTPIPVAERFNHWGTQIRIGKLRHWYTKETIQKCARELGLVFAPALRRGVDLRLYHHLVSGDSERIEVKAFNPVMTDEIEISGEIEMPRVEGLRWGGNLRWSGRAGMCENLTERQSGAHIAFMHRVIENTKDPFKGRSVPNLYVEVQLDETTPWKFQLSTHKDRIVKYRDQLINNIHEQIKELVDRAANRTREVRLDMMLAPIVQSAAFALQKIGGELRVDPNEDPLPGGKGRRRKPVPPHPNPRPGPFDKKLRHKTKEGEEARPVPGPTGIKLDWRTREQLEDKAYSWEFSGSLLTLLLDKEMFEELLNWNERQRVVHNRHAVAALVSQAVEFEFLHGNATVIKDAISPEFYRKVEQWHDNDSEEKIAPYLYRAIIDNMPA